MDVYRSLKCKAKSKQESMSRSAKRLLSVSMGDDIKSDCRNAKGKREPLFSQDDPGCHISKDDFLQFYLFLTDDVLLKNRLAYDSVDRVYADYSSRSIGGVCENLLQATRNPCLQGWEFVKKLGQGSFGAVFLVKRGAERAAVKFMVHSPRFFTSIEQEVEMQRLFASYGLAPKIICYNKMYAYNKDLHVVLMEPIDFTLFTLACHYKMSDRTLTKVGDAIMASMMKLNKLGFTHGDMHSKNIGFVRQPDGKVKLMFIDFGQSSTMINDPVVDAEQLLSELKEIQFAKPRLLNHIESVLNRVVQRIKPSYGKLKGTRRAFKKAHQEYDKYIGTNELNLASEGYGSLNTALAAAVDSDVIDLVSPSPPLFHGEGLLSAHWNLSSLPSDLEGAAEEVTPEFHDFFARLA